MLAASDKGLGDDNQSWEVNGMAQVAMHNGKETDYMCARWRRGDVIGLGIFATPHGVVFEIAPGAVGEGLFAAFSGHSGKVCFNLGGASFKYAPPATDFAAFDDEVAPMSADHPQEDDEPPSVAEIIERSAHGCPWMDTLDVREALDILETKGRITHSAAV